MRRKPFEADEVDVERIEVEDGISTVTAAEVVVVDGASESKAKLGKVS